MSKNKKIILIILSIFIVLGLFLGVSYAYYIKSINQEESNVVKTKCLNFSLTNEKNDIKLDEQYPIPDSEGRKLTPYQFTITNTCEQFISYNVNLESLEATTMDSSAVKVMINNEAPVNLSTLESTSVSIDTSKDSKILATGSLGSNDSVDYALRLWMDYGDNVDTSSMNKVFESKVVVTATVGTYKPSDYVTTLQDAILVNEYKVKTPDNAISKIAAKETPDFNKTAPIIVWQENHETTNTNLNIDMPDTSLVGNASLGGQNLNADSSKVRLSTGYTFNSEKGQYAMTDSKLYSAEDLASLDFSSVAYYIVGGGTNISSSNVLAGYNSSSGTYLYKVTSVTTSNVGTANTNSYRIRYAFKTNRYTETELESDKSDKGLYTAQDDYGTSYYYRGNVSNNNVYFAGAYWKIIRINGDGTIRLLYNGTKVNAKGGDTQYGTSAFNSTRTDPAYVGYMYGTTTGAIGSRENNLANGKDSNIKTKVDEFYNKYIVANNLQDYLADTGFCGDRSITNSGDGYSTTSYTEYGAVNRLAKTNKLPILTCPDKEHDLYTVDSTNGNGALTNPIGLMTADEAAMAGMVNGYLNTLSYVYTGTWYWTMSPYSFRPSGSASIVWSVGGTGYFSGDWVPGGYGVRPAINLKADVEISGGIGTVNDPYIVKTT